MKSLLREPLLHFTLVAALLVGAHRLYSAHSRPEVTVTPEWLDSLARDFELKSGRAPNETERANLAHAWLENEILCREALKAGHTDDTRVRGLLAAIMRETLEPVIADPSDADLEAFRRQHPEPFSYPAQVSFEQATFTKEDKIPAGMLKMLRAGEPPPQAEALRLPNPMPMTWLPQLEKTFGTEFAAAVVAAKPGEWTGPLTSSRGVHFIKVVRYDAPREMPIEDVRPALVAKWLEAQRNAAVSAKVAEMRANYRIELPPGIPAP
ncbi:peptidylprolyl isomerase [Luteolibacter arcticus]|uniref:Peptidylprolyl isomerase n=1 Tax=Luteolibacter arcticus TaxID=1581411 RepID=A0ABT3GNI9_9BACT|nr:peptidylprolyl isomerase [Luteolibacter arcticus]MCW1925084.1 peptidylprolyl isomerase [Luteolibacter arcticus]